MRRLALLLLICLPVAAADAKKSRVRVPVWIDSHESSEAALSLKQLSAKIDGVPAKIVSSRGPKDDLLILLVLDLTEDVSTVEVAKQALIEALRKLPQNANVAVLRAQDGLRVLLDPGADRGAVADAVRNLPVSGKAGLLDTIESAARLGDSLFARASVRIALVYITDSNINNYREDFINPVINSSDSHDLSRHFPEGLVKDKISKVEARISACETPVFIVHLDYRSDRLNEAYQTGLMQLAAAAGGTSAFCRSRVDVPNAIAQVFDAVSGHYSVVLQMPERPSRMLEVKLDNGGRALTYRNRFSIER